MRRSRRGLLGCVAAGTAALVVAGTGSGPVAAEDPAGAAPDADFLGRAVGHYAQAERELAAADVSRLSPAQRVARAEVLDELRRYRVARDFGRNVEHPSERLHLFVDAGGRRCAVAQLLHRTGDDSLVSDVAASRNGAFVSDLAAEPRFVAWLDRVGLSVEEAARIQGPGVPPRPTDTPGQTLDGSTGETGEAGGTDGRSAGGSASPGGGVPGPGGDGNVRARTAGTGDRPLGAAGADGWWIWWEMNKLAWMRPARDRLEPLPATAGHDADEELATRREIAVLRLLPLLSHRDAVVRKAAAGALGRVGGAMAVPRIAALLEDRNVEVRDRALLALGATADARAAEILLRVARTGGADAAHARGGRISPSARPLAIVALGLARRRGLAIDPGEEIARIADDATGTEKEPLAVAATLHHLLARSAALTELVEENATDENASAAVRGRALEALAPRGDAAAVRVLQRALGSRQVDVRRSAAVALGDEPNALVAPHLMTAVEYERDALARGFALIAIGERGGARAESFLAGTLTGDEDAPRPWAALALGLFARTHGGDDARDALRTAEVRGNQRGAVWLGRALAGDEGTVAPCTAALGGSDPGLRAHAAVALGVVGGDAAAAALRERARVDRDDVSRVALAHALALRGETADAEFLGSVAHDVDAEWLRPPLAMALGVHRTRATFGRLLAVLASESSPSHELATAAEAIGLAVDPVPEPSLPVLSRGTNFAAVPAWLLEALRTTL